MGLNVGERPPPLKFIAGFDIRRPAHGYVELKRDYRDFVKSALLASPIILV